MKTESDVIDYGIYIDRKVSFIISLNHVIHEQFMDEYTEENDETSSGSNDVNQQLHIQNKKNEQLKKYCKLIIEKIDKAHQILIFGPSVSKFELQKEIGESKRLKHIKEEILVTDVMDKEEAVRFVKHHFSPGSAKNIH